MRFDKGLAAALFGMAVIAGCRTDGEAERQALIEQETKDCVDGFSKSRGGAAGLDGQRICDCAVGKLTAGKDAEQLRKLTQETKPSDTDIRTMGACVVEEAQRKGVVSK
jgi:hypothetical protein